jgi:hypothetical protein
VKEWRSSAEAKADINRAIAAYQAKKAK